MSTKIECTVKRPGGTEVSIGPVLYKFLPDESGRHVAVVEDPAHVKAFLDVKEAYRLADGASEPEKVPAAAVAAVVEQKAEEPAEESEEAAEPPAEKPAEEHAATLAPKDEHVHGPECNDPYAHKGGPDGDPNTLDREELARAYAQKFGRRPHGKWDAERILAELKV